MDLNQELDSRKETQGPGFTHHNTNFSIKFMSATQHNQRSHLLEFGTDWQEVLLAVLEVEPRDSRKVEQLASTKLE